MVRISNVDIPSNKSIPFALTYIEGIGQPRAKKIVNKLNIDSKKKAKDLTETEIRALNEEIKQFPTEGELRRIKQEIISNEIRLGTYRGLRRLKNLQVNGQRTRHNARTAKGHVRKTVANKKKPLKPK